jgi:Domain of unknown function (DUF4331)
MAHHYSGPDVGFPRGDARLDITDLYAFAKPGDASRSIVIMDVHPSFSLEPQGPTTTEPFAPEAIYELRVDTNADLVADIAYRVRFSHGGDGGGMVATVRRATGPSAAGTSEEGDVIVHSAPVSMGSRAQVTDVSGCRFFAGWRSDPFFFDVLGVLNNMQVTGDDYFADKNVCSIALELPNSVFGSGGGGGGAGVNLWGRTLVQQNGGEWVQADRGARPNQTPFLAGDGADREAYLGGEPAQDGRFVANFAHALEHTGGYEPQRALAVARSLLPDVLPYDPRRPAAYPNGRALTDDVSDVFLSLFTNGKVRGDSVGPHTDLLDEFPYVGVPHNSNNGNAN